MRLGLKYYELSIDLKDQVKSILSCLKNMIEKRNLRFSGSIGSI